MRVTFWANADVCSPHFIALHAAKHLSVSTRPWRSMRPGKLRLLGGSTSMDIIGLKHESANQIKRLTHSPCVQRFMHGRIWAAQTVWRHIQGLNTHVLGPTQSDRLRRESSKNSLITTRYKKKRKKRKRNSREKLACSLGLREVLWEERRRRGWPLVLLTASVDYREAKRRLAVRLICESVGNVSEHYAESTSTGQFSTFVSISLMPRLYLVPSTISFRFQS